MSREGMKRADKRASITILVLGDEGVGKSSLISTFVSRYFSDVVPGIMTRVRLPPDPETSCVTTIVDSQGGDAALINAMTSMSMTMTQQQQQRQTQTTKASAESFATLLEQQQQQQQQLLQSSPLQQKQSQQLKQQQHQQLQRPISSSLSSSSSEVVGVSRGSSPVDNVDSIILVYDLDRVETFFRLENHWLPLIERCYSGKIPVIVAENKVDLYRPSSSTAGMSDEQAIQRKRQQIVSLMQRFPFVRQCIKCSAKNLLRVDDIFIKAQQAVIYPFTPPLYDLETGQLTVECKRAFTRIFRMYDRDHDGALSDAELHRFQRETYHVAVFERDFAAWKKVVTRNNPNEQCIQDGKFTIAGFLTIFDVFISQNRLDVVWQALRKFGYDDDLNLHVPESVLLVAPTTTTTSTTSTTNDEIVPIWRLSSSAKRFLSALFHQFDSNKDGILEAQDILNMFSILPPPALPPWHPIRAAELFSDSFSKPLDYHHHRHRTSSSSDSTTSSSPGSDSPTGGLGPSLLFSASAAAGGSGGGGAAAATTTAMSQSLITNSGISILSAGDSLPSVDVARHMGHHPISRPLTFLEWMGLWHVVATISPAVARAELFRLGHVEETSSSSKNKHESGSSSLIRRKSASSSSSSASASRWKKGTVHPTDFVYDATLRSREIRVLVLGSKNSGKTALLNYLRGRGDSSHPASPSSSSSSASKATDTKPSTVPETSTTYVKLKRKLTNNNKATDEDGEEFVVHLVFTDVPETAAASQEAHLRNLTELFGSSAAIGVANQKDRMCDLAMLVFDSTKASTLDYVKSLERTLLTKETPRVFVATKADLIVRTTTTTSPAPEEDATAPPSTVLEAAELHCREEDLESPLVTSAEDASAGTERNKVLDHLARCALFEPGVQRLKARPHEEQKRREAAKRRMMWLGGIVSVGIVVAVGVGLLWGSAKKDKKGSRWFRFWFGAAAATTEAATI